MSTTKSDVITIDEHATVKRVILQRIALGDQLGDVALTEGIGLARIQEWTRSDHDFAEGLKLAREARAHLDVEDAMAIAEHAGETHRDLLSFDEHGELRAVKREVVYDATKLGQDRLRVEVRKWRAAKWLPRVYGDNTRHEHTGEGGGAMRLLIGSTAEAYEAEKARKLKGTNGGQG